MELEEKSVDESERPHWSKLSSQIDLARIGTIHSLCAEIIRNHPAEAGVDPRFDVIDDGLSKAMCQGRGRGNGAAGGRGTLRLCCITS